MLDRFAGGRGRGGGDKGRGDETIGSADNIFKALMPSVYVDGLILILSLSNLRPNLALTAAATAATAAADDSSSAPEREKEDEDEDEEEGAIKTTSLTTLTT